MHNPFFYFVALLLKALYITLLYRIFRLWRRWAEAKRWFVPFAVFYWGISLLSLTPLFMILFWGRNDWPIAFESFWAYPAFYVQAWFFSHFFLLPLFILYMFGKGVFFGGLRLARYSAVVWQQKVLRARHESGQESVIDQPQSRATPEVEQKGRESLSRRHFFARVGSGFPLVATGLLGSGFAAGHPPRFWVNKISLSMPARHGVLRGLRIMQISDLHIGPVVNRNYLERARRVMLSQKADLLVVTGDIIDNNNYYLGLAQEFFSSIKGHFPLGIYGVLGNHDFIDNGEELSRSLTEVGVRMLRNEAVRLSSAQGKWQLIGLDYPMHTWRESSSRAQVAARYLEQALAGRKEENLPGIVLNHHPSDFSLFARHDIPLTLAGHTHGGQIVIPGTNFAPIGDFFSYSRGVYHRGEQHLYVNQGLGHWFPLRIQCDPEITLLQLT